ncbi:MAG: hypothetical protein JWQ32_3269 [Marmoricola sp.]|nr:hypothetical protein [Marmoricola sp.]
MPRLIRPAAALLCVAAVANLVSGCSSGQPAISTPPSAVTSAPSLTAGVASNGTTVSLQRGERLRVTLSSTYWRFGSVAGGVLAASGQRTTPSTTQSGSTCVPGQGCGTASETFTATRSGRARITASRTSCGEAMACVGSAGSYELLVVVR